MLTMDSKWIIIGIGGATCSGKTTIANELHKRIVNSTVIHQDDYYYPMGSPQLEYIEEFKHYNWDLLSSVDSDKLISAVQSTIQDGESQRRILIVDGHLIYNIPRMMDFFTKKYFTIVPKEIGRFRRRTRAYKRYDERYYDHYVWPLYEFHKQEVLSTYGEKEFVFIDGEKDLNENVDSILKDVALLYQSHENGRGIILVEGIFIMNSHKLREMCSLKYYLTLPFDICKKRRAIQTYTSPDPATYFDTVVWPQHTKYKSELTDDGIKFIDSHENDISSIVRVIMEDLNRIISKTCNSECLIGGDVNK